MLYAVVFYTMRATRNAQPQNITATVYSHMSPLQGCQLLGRTCYTHLSGIKLFPLKIKKSSSSEREQVLPKRQYLLYNTSQMIVSYFREYKKYLTNCMYLVACGIHFFIDNSFHNK